MLRLRYVVVRLCLSRLFADMVRFRSKIELGRAIRNEDGLAASHLYPLQSPQRITFLCRMRLKRKA